jgi:hypothetical protein
VTPATSCSQPAVWHLADFGISSRNCTSPSALVTQPTKYGLDYAAHQEQVISDVRLTAAMCGALPTVLHALTVTGHYGDKPIRGWAYCVGALRPPGTWLSFPHDVVELLKTAIRPVAVLTLHRWSW